MIDPAIVEIVILLLCFVIAIVGVYAILRIMKSCEAQKTPKRKAKHQGEQKPKLKEEDFEQE